MDDRTDQETRTFGTGIPVVHQGELDDSVRTVLDAALPYEPLTDRFALASVWLRVEERWTDGTLGARIGLRTAGWRSLPNLPQEIAEDEDIEDAFLGMATRLPAPYVEHVSGALLRYDTNSFEREGSRAYHMQYLVMGTATDLVSAVQELRRANDVRWKKAHTMVGYLPGGEEHSDRRAADQIDAMYGPGTWARWCVEIEAYDGQLGDYFQAHALARIPKPAPPSPQPIGFDHDLTAER